MKHNECMEKDEEYKRTYDLMLKHGLDIDKILEVVVKSNGMVGVGIVTFNDNIDKHLATFMRGY